MSGRGKGGRGKGHHQGRGGGGRGGGSGRGRTTNNVNTSSTKSVGLTPSIKNYTIDYGIKNCADHNRIGSSRMRRAQNRARTFFAQMRKGGRTRPSPTTPPQSLHTLNEFGVTMTKFHAKEKEWIDTLARSDQMSSFIHRK